MELEEFLRGKAAALAFSGGADSALLLAAAVKAGCRVQPYFVHSAFQPAFELEDAQRLCAQLGVELRVLEAKPLEDEQVRANGPQRCYYCKRMIFSALASAADPDSAFTLLWTKKEAAAKCSGSSLFDARTTGVSFFSVPYPRGYWLTTAVQKP